MKKYCTKCGHEFESVGREVICPSCRESAKEEAKKAAVLKAKRASWNGESVPVRISGRASTIVREFGKAHDVPFAQALDELLKASPFFISIGKAWEDVEPYKSRRRDKHATETAGKQDAPQDERGASQASKPQAASKAVKTSKAAGKAGKKVC